MKLLTIFVLLLSISLCLAAVSSQKLHGISSPMANSPLVNSDPVSVAKHAILPARKSSYSEDYELLLKQIKNEIFQISRSEILSRVNFTCKDSIETMVKDFASDEKYTTAILDAWGKPESGIENGNTRWEGRYFECQNAEKTINKTRQFGGQWCYMHAGAPPNALSVFGVGAGIDLGICVPDTCSEDEVNEITYGALIALNVSLGDIMVYAACPIPHDWDAGAIVAIIITAILGLLVIFGTVAELLNKKKYKQKKLISNDGDDELLLDAMSKQTSSFYSKFVTSFSLDHNTNAFLNTEKREGNIHCLHGMRFISMSWVILGHSFLFPLSVTDNVVDFANFFIGNASFMVILNGTFSVDSFFFLSGLLVAFLGMRELTRRNGQINIPKMYLSRYLRLTPAYAFCILISVSLFMLMGNGPYWTISGQALTKSCVKYWWTNLLYINNLYPLTLGEECFGWGWYLANDMQFYLLAPFFLLLLYRKPKIGVAALAIGTVVSITITGAISSYYGLQPNPNSFGALGHLVTNTFTPPTFVPNGNATASKADQFGSDIYTKPWFRIGAYFIGMLTGYILHVTKGNLKMNKFVVIIGWTVAAIMELALLYGLYPFIKNGEYVNNNTAAFYNAVSRPLWAVGLAWVVIACVNGYGGPVNAFLSWRGFIPLSRLTYCCYLVHPLILSFLYNTTEVDIHFSVTLFIVYFIAALLLANGIGYVVSMLVEAPMLGIQNAIFPKKSPGKRIVEYKSSDEVVTDHAPIA